MKKIVEKEVTICDVCECEQRLWGTCVICGKEHCLTCEGIGTNPYRIDLCKICIKREDVEKVLTESLKPYRRQKTRVTGRLKGLSIGD